MRHPFYNRQQGFTLLELLVVITLIAVLAVGALVAYDGVGDKAEAAAAADANVSVDNAIRQFKAVTNIYPNQWDNLVAEDGNLIDALPEAIAGTDQEIAAMALGAAASNVTASLGRAGILELQNWLVATKSNNATGVVPNLAHNESFNPLNAVEREYWEDGGMGDDGPIQNIAVVRSAQGCTANGVTIPNTGVARAANGNTVQNRYSDYLETNRCHLVVALGFGADAAASTTGASVTIGKAPSFSRTDKTNPANNVNPNEHYSRFIGLFLVGSGGSGAGADAIVDSEYLEKARLIALIAPDGTVAEQNQATAVKN